VLPEGEYGAFEFKNGDVYIMSAKAALGLAHQDFAYVWGQVMCHLQMTGQDLLGLALKAPGFDGPETSYSCPHTGSTTLFR